MRRFSILLGLTTLLILSYPTPVASVPSGQGFWAFISEDSSVCLATTGRAGRVCAVWDDRGAEEDGLICCVDPEKLSRNQFGDCEWIAGRRARPSSL